MSADYFVKLDRFEGPLDLLLHLIKVHEIDIFAIDIFKLTTEYLNYLRLIDFDDINEAGNFISMAATLIEIKSRSLLPEDKNKKHHDSDDEGDIDSVESLQQRLIQYEMIRKAAEYLGQRPQIGVEIQTGHEHERLAPLFAHVETPIKGDTATLIILYGQMLSSLAERKYGRVQATMHLITLEQTIEKLHQYVDTVRFSLFQSFYYRFTSRYDFVVYFMAVLELSKVGKVKVYQQEFLGPLWIYKPDLDVSDLPSVLPTTPSNEELYV